MFACMRDRRLGPSLVFLTGVIVATLTGCSGFGPRSAPDWVHGMSQEYPADHYLLGLGQAESQEVAEERAYAGVAKIFNARVTAQFRDWESYLLLETRGSAKTKRRLTLDRVTRVSTDKVLENVRILNRWRDRDTNQSYALAGMHRGQAAVALSERIVTLDRAIDSAITKAHRTQDSLAKIRNMRRAIKDLLLREAYNADLRVIRTSGQGSLSPYRVAKLTSELEQFLSAHLIVGVEITGDQAEPVRRALLEGLIREGLPATAEEVGAGGQARVGAPGGGQHRHRPDARHQPRQHERPAERHRRVAARHPQPRLVMDPQVRQGEVLDMRADPRQLRPVTNRNGRAWISWPAPATPMMIASPQPRCVHESAWPIRSTLPTHSNE